MKNKGFTLIELLGVIVILGIIGAITFPIISNVISKGYSDIDAKQKTAIERAAKNWANNNQFNIKQSISVSELKEEGYLDDSNITNPKNGESYDCSKVNITNNNGKFEFNFEFNKCS